MFFKKFFYEFISFFDKDKVQGKQFRRKKVQELAELEVKKAKWGVSYSLFDGEELLEASLQSVRSEVDYINVVYQNTSWFGAKNDTDLLPMLEELKAKGLIDEIIFFEPNLKFHPQKNERNKRTLGLKHAKKFGCHYFMTMDVDEFYRTKDLQEAKYYMLRYGITHGYCNIIDHGLLPTQRLKNSSPYAVQFFSRIYFFSRTVKRKHFFATVDPSRTISNFPFAKHFFLQNVNMYHMSSIRKDYAKKQLNSSCREFSKNNDLALNDAPINPLEPFIDNNDVYEVSNEFNINITECASTDNPPI